jgi:hypothetical protein
LLKGNRKLRPAELRTKTIRISNEVYEFLHEMMSPKLDKNIDDCLKRVLPDPGDFVEDGYLIGSIFVSDAYTAEVMSKEMKTGARKVRYV